MVKLHFNIPFGGKHEINVPTFRLHKSKLEKYSYSLYLINQFAYLLFIFLLPVSTYLYPNKSPETSTFLYIIFGIIILLGLFLANISLLGKKVLMDPKGFIPILVFAFLVTTSALTVTPATEKNTFGVEYLRGLAGIFSMAMVVFFYITTVFVRDIKFLKKVITAFVLGCLLLAYTMIFEKAKLDDILLLLTAIPFSFTLAFFRKSVNYIYILIAFLFTFLALDSKLLVREGFEDITNPSFIPLTVLILAGFISFLTCLWFIAVLSRQNLAKGLEMIIDKKIVVKKSLLKKVALVSIIPVVLLGSYFFYLDRGVESKAFIDAGLNSNESAFEFLNDDKSDGLEKIKHIIFGNGAEYINTNTTYFSNVIVIFGISGILAILILITSSVLFLLKLIKFSEKNKLYNPYLLFLFFSFVANILILAISYSGIYFVFITFFIISLVYSSNFLIERKHLNHIISKEINFSVTEFSFLNKRKSYILRSALSASSIILSLVLIGIIVNVVDKI